MPEDEQPIGRPQPSAAPDRGTDERSDEDFQQPHGTALQNVLNGLTGDVDEDALRRAEAWRFDRRWM